MDSVIDVESRHIVAVLEETVTTLELTALLPERSESTVALSPAATRTLERHAALETALLDEAELTGTSALDEQPEVDDWPSVHAAAFPASLHCVIQLLAHDKATRDALRLASATRVTPAFTRFALAWSQLSMHVEHALSTSIEQDELAAASVRASKLRLREAEDDRQQVAFELAHERNAHMAMTARLSATIAALQEQLADTQQRAVEALATTARGREEDLHTALSAFETQSTAANEKTLAATRLEARALDEHKQFEADERKRMQRVSTDVRELIARYDDDMAALDSAIAAEQSELERLARAAATLAAHVARMDDDRRHQLDELRAIDDATRQRHQRELNVFRFVQKLQAAVRGFLVRRQYRQQLQALKKTRRKLKKKKKGKSSGSPKRTSRSSSSATKRASPRKPVPLATSTTMKRTSSTVRPSSDSSKSARKPTPPQR